MAKKQKREEEYSHPRLVKFMGVISTLFIIGSFTFNGVVGVSGMLLDWGFYPNKLQPSISPSLNGTTLAINIPVYVKNTGIIGFDVTGLTIDFNIWNETSIIATQENDIGSIPHGTEKIFDVTMIKEDALALAAQLNGSSAITLEILFHVSYIVTTIEANLTIELPGGLSF